MLGSIPRSFLVAGSLLLLSACAEEPRACPLIGYPPPELRVYVRDAVSSAPICDAKVELQRPSAEAGQALSAGVDQAGACLYRSGGKTFLASESATVIVSREGYTTATMQTAPSVADECGVQRDVQQTVSLTPAP